MYSSIYLAGGWFSNSQINLINKAYDSFKVLENDFTCKIHCPYKEPNVDNDSSPAAMYQVFVKNCFEIEKCNIFIACLDQTHLDTGTIFELGYAYKANKIIYILYDDVINMTEEKFEVNLMLAASSKIYTNPQDIINDIYLNHLEQTLIRHDIKTNIVNNKLKFKIE